MQHYYKKSRRRVVRTFNFNRILAFVTVVCFAVALLLVFISIEFPGASKAVKKRTLYIVTVGSDASQSEASRLAADCRRRGGAGYLLSGPSFKVAASLYTAAGEAAAVAQRLNGENVSAEVFEVEIKRLKLGGNNQSLVGPLLFCAYSLPDKLCEITLGLDKREISEALAAKECSLLAAQAAALSVETAGGEADSRVRATLSALLDALTRSLETACVVTDDPLSARLRYALCESAVRTSETFQRLESML